MLCAALAGPARGAVTLTTDGTFTNPIYATAPRADATSLYVVERAGRIRIVRNGSTVQGFLNGVGGTLTTISVPANFDALTTAVSNHIVGPLVVGAAFVDGGPTAQSGWNGGIKEIRVYNNAHSAAQVAAVSTAMTT